MDIKYLKRYKAPKALILCHEAIRARSLSKEKEEEKPLFRMKRFENVAPKFRAKDHVIKVAERQNYMSPQPERPAVKPKYFGKVPNFHPRNHSTRNNPNQAQRSTVNKTFCSSGEKAVFGPKFSGAGMHSTAQNSFHMKDVLSSHAPTSRSNLS